MNRAEELIREAAADWRAADEVRVSQWADRNFFLSPEYSARPGPWVTMPFQREPIDCIGFQSVSQIVVKASTQMLKTSILQIATAYAIAEDPGPILIVQPSTKDAGDFSRERVAPMIRDTPCLAALVRDSKTNKSDNTISQKWFPGGFVAIVSARIPSDLARRSIRYLFVDEEDIFRESAGKQGDPISLAAKRQATFRHRKKTIRGCSPTFRGSSIDRAYQRSDQREFYVPCHKCGHEQTMMGWKKWTSQVRWNDKLPTREEQAQSARYYCESCDTPWDDAARWQAVDRGCWKANAPFHGTAGFWIGELYSPWKQLWEIVLDFLMKKDNPIEFQTWVNTSLAENWEEPGEVLDYERLVYRREDYPVGNVPDGGLFLVAGADVQRADGGRIECEILAFGENRETWSVDYRILYGNPAEAAVWEQLESLLHETFPHACGAEMSIDRLFVDSGDGEVTRDVYEWVQKQSRPRVWAIKGYRRGDQPVSGPRDVEGKKKAKLGAILRNINVNFFKDALYADLRKRAPTPEERAKGFQFPQGFCHFPKGDNYGDEHFRQICAEQIISRRDQLGRMKSEYVKRWRNEALDARIYAMAASWDFGVHRFQAKHWSMLRQRLAEMAKRLKVEKETQKTPVPPVPAAAAREEQASSWIPDRRGWLR